MLLVYHYIYIFFLLCLDNTKSIDFITFSTKGVEVPLINFFLKVLHINWKNYSDII